MTLPNTTDRYHRASIVLHWAMLVLFVGIYASIELRGLFDKGTPPREAMKSLHFMLGLLVLALVWLRVALRFKYPAPPIQPAPSLTQDKVARLAHLLLYVFMIGMPLAGWLLLSAAGKPIPFFGLELPALIGPDKALASQIKEIHEVIGTAGYFLIAVHAAAALFHHYVLRDNTLLRMRPR
ncbi:MAG: cytochrome b [Pseudomonadota bacterium]